MVFLDCFCLVHGVYVAYSAWLICVWLIFLMVGVSRKWDLPGGFL